GATASTYVVQEGDEGHKLDVVVTVTNEDGVSVTATSAATSPVPYDSADLSFANASYLAGSGPEFFAVGDLNGDGFPDIAAPLNYQGGIALLFNDGHGGFSAPTVVDYLGPRLMHAAAIADLNGDGIPDLVAPLDRGPGNPDSALSVVLGTGN